MAVIAVVLAVVVDGHEFTAAWAAGKFLWMAAGGLVVGLAVGDTKFTAKFLDYRNVVAPQVPGPLQEVAAAALALKRDVPLVAFTASGGARMQEGALALMQMARTTLSIQDLKKARLPYIVVLTDPTTGGVTASYAMLGDVQLAEPGALIGFTGPRVIEQTIRETLPPGFQRSEYLVEKGMVDRVTPRKELPAIIGSILTTMLMGRARLPAA